MNIGKKIKINHLIADFGLTMDFKSSGSKIQKKNIFHFFLNYNSDLNLENFLTKNLN